MNCYFFITDKNCLDYAIIAINSLLRTNPRSDIVLYAKDCYPEIEGITVVPIKEIEHLGFSIKNITVNALDLLGHRLRVLDELKERYDKILMLDTDIIVLKSIEELFNLSGKFIFGRDELEDYRIFRNTIHNELWYDSKVYLNSGVLMISSDVIKEVNLFESFKKELKVRSFKYLCPEQDFINYMFRDRLFNIGDSINQQVMSERPKNPKVLHFAGPAKPTRSDVFFMKNCRYFYDIFDENLELNRSSISEEFYFKNKNALKERL